MQFVLISLILNDSIRDYEDIRSEVITILITFLFVHVVVLLLVASYIKVTMKRALSPVKSIIKDIEHGDFKKNINSKSYQNRYDPEIVELIEDLEKMLSRINNFDEMKKAKIAEQKHRLLALLKLTENGFVILDHKGNILYISSKIEEYFPVLKTECNISEINPKYEVDANIKQYISNILKTKSGLTLQKSYFMKELRIHIEIENQIVRDVEGNITGLVICIKNLNKHEMKDNKDCNDK